MFQHRKKIIGLLICLGIFTIASFAFAQPNLGLNEFGSQTNLGTKSLGVTIAEIVRIFLSVLGVIAVIIILYAGFLWMTAAGSAEKIATAKKLIFNAVIGLAIILASVAITQFVLSALQNATGSNVSGGGEGGGGGGGGFGSESFTLSGISPQGNVPIRNVVVRISFNHAVTEALVSGNILILRRSDNSIVSGDFNVAGDKVEFVPSTACPAPNQSLRCFDENTAYRVEVNTGLQDTGGRNLVCGGFAAPCTAEFTTGALIDALPPQVAITYPDPGQSVPQNGLVPVWAAATDDSAVSHVEFYADGAYFDRDFPNSSVPSFNAQVFWDTSGVSRGGHNLSAQAYDIDSNNAFSPPVNVIVRASHCFNAQMDFDETGIDCGGTECAICSGASCQQNSDCASGSCQNGVCTDTPIILGMSPQDGAPGTYVTIFGKYFGANAGTVTFLGGDGSGDDRAAQLAPCSGAWTDTQIVAIVPSGAANGPLSIVNSTGSDATNDARGPVLPSFIINNVSRPGICNLVPSEGKSGTDFNIVGNNFGGNQGGGFIKFGNVYSVPKAWSAVQITAVVPVLEAGINSVSVVQNNVESNAVNFNLLSQTSGTKPIINYVNPDNGPASEYITIFGSNLGDDIGVVEFLRNDGTKALGDVNFPTACGAVDYWKNSSITVKVPAQFADGSPTRNAAVSLRVRRLDNELSNSIPFNINSSAPAPGICGLNPSNGPVGTNVDILGERLGTGGTITFYNNVNATPGSWGSEVVKTAVPNNTVSGPVKVNVAGTDSNSANFTVGDCSKTPSICGVSEQCCSSSCIPKTSQCQPAPREGAYAWRFSTGFIPRAPKVVENCSVGTGANTPSPSPWNARPGGNSVCRNAVINIRFDTRLDPNTVIMNGVAADTVAVYRCVAAGGDICGTKTKISADPVYTGIYLAGAEQDRIQFYPAGGLERSTNYLVELTTGIRGAGQGGGYMEEKQDCGNGIAYCFNFKTSDSDGLCRVGSIVTSPTDFTADAQELLDYQSIPRAKEDVCLVLDASAYSYAWSSSQPSRASIRSVGMTTDNRPMNNAAVIQTLAETLPDNPDIITSSILSENVSGDARLTIDFADPAVVNKWPSCTTACVNSTIGAEFNIPMDPSTLVPANISVLRCLTENCDTFSGSVAGSISYNSIDKTFDFIPSASLETNAFYQTRIDAVSVRSLSGVSLTGANFGRYLVWQFRTRNDGTPCTVNKVNVTPVSATMYFIPQKLILDSEALGAPDSCNPQGQKLNPYSLNWAWSSTQPAVASLLNGGAYNVLPKNSAACNNVCLSVGSKSNASICGNGILEKGESCDDGNTIAGDGCSVRCLNEGTNPPLCSNGLKDRGEDCDDGAAKSGDGCSANCLVEGSSSGGSVCGNGVIGKGESCDDGNAVSGDGCSAQCFNEGSEPNIASCGNGILENGEQCDDGNGIAGDGCSLICLNEGSAYGGTVCGNGVISNGESCDDGNAVSGDGCSSQCLNEGSSVNYAAPSICGDGIAGAGEDAACESSVPADSNVDPRQYAQAEGQGSAKIRATVSNVSGESDVTVQCVYTTDLQCAPFGPNLGAGTDNCCYQKPQIENVVPSANQTGVCRNTLISFTFNQLMAGEAGSVSIDEQSGATWNVGAIKVSRVASDDQNLSRTTFNLNIASILKSNTRYRISISGFVNKKGVAGGDYLWTFMTGGDICKFDKINFNPDPVIFDKIETKPVAATAISFRDNFEQPIAPVPGVYEWSWNWTEVNLKDSISLANTSSATVQATSKQKNGSGYLNALAVIIRDIYNLSPNKSIVNQVPTTVFLCEQPWPADGQGHLQYFTDTTNNFRTYYCRDNAAGDLPYLNVADVQVNIGPLSDITREFLFTDPSSGDAVGIRVYKNLDHLSPAAWYAAKQFQGQPQSVAADGYDAITDGRSTYINAANHTTGGANYTNIFVVSYSQNATTAMQNIYKQMAENLKFNINLNNFKVCNNSGRSCSSDLDCEPGDICLADKDKLTRDTKRLADFNDIAGLLANYKNNADAYPQLLSGSFLRGISVSVWPSWQAALGNDLGKALPSDPINKHGNCGVGYDPATCWSGAQGRYVCPPGSHVYQYANTTQGNNADYELGSDFEYNNAAGWSSIKNNFIINGVCSGIEIGTSVSCGDGVVGESEECEKGDATAESCIVNGRTGFRKLTCGADCMWDRSVICQAGQCGDDIVQAPETCDDGTNNGKYGYCNANCRALVASCGDGLKNGNEQCDNGAQNGVYGSGCSWDCKLPGPSCGDNIINGTEQCDGNSEKIKDAIAGLPACGIQNGYQTYRTRTCGASCSWNNWSDCLPEGSCGNGAKEGTEQCDTGNSGTSGACVMDLVKGYACRTAVCGDGYTQAGKEICDSGIQNGIACLAGYGLTCNYCSTSCTLITRTGAYCGDTIKNGPEECDANDFGGLRCKNYGFLEFSSGGLANRTSLSCGADCKALTSGCNSVLRVNVGGPSFMTAGGESWVSDAYYDSGSNKWPGDQGINASVQILNTDNPMVYRTTRYGYPDVGYSFPVGNGTYRVRLHFAQIFGDPAQNNYPPQGAGIWDIALENKIVLDNFDIMDASAGGAATPNTAVVKEFVAQVTDGVLNISGTWVGGTWNNPIIAPAFSGIEIESSNLGGGQYN